MPKIDIDMMSTNANGRFVPKDGTPYPWPWCANESATRKSNAVPSSPACVKRSAKPACPKALGVRITL